MPSQETTMMIQKGRSKARPSLAFAIVACMAVVGHSYGQVGTVTPTLLNRYGLGECRHILTYNDFVIFGSSSAVTLFDVHEPSSPKAIGQVFLPNEVHDLAVAGSHVYVANGNNGLIIIDISDPTRPLIVGKHKTPGGTVGYPPEEDGAALCVSLRGKYAIVGIRNNGLQVIDVSLPEHPVPVGRYSSYEDIYMLRVYGNLAYAASNKLPCLKVFDLSDPAKPRLASETDLQGAVSICQEAGRLYVFGGRQLSIYDLKVKEHPKWIRDISLTINSQVHDGVVSEGIAYCVGSIGLKVLDVHDADTPKELLSQSLGLLMAVGVKPGYLYAGQWNGLQIIDISNLPAIQVKGETFGRVFSPAMVAENDRLYLAASIQNEFRLLTLNVADPNSLQEISDLKMDTERSARPTHAEIHADRLYLLIGRDLVIFDLADRDRPRLLGKWQSRDFLTDLCFQGRYLLVTTEKQSLEILDCSRPNDVQILGSFHLSGRGVAIHTIENFAYVLIKDQGVTVVDLGDVARPSVVADVRMNANTTGGFATIGPRNLLCVAGARELNTLDVSNPAQPKILGSFSSDAFYDSCQICASGSEAYVIATRGVFFFDLSDPVHPSLKDRFPLSGPLMGIACLRGIIYIASQSDLCLISSR